MPLSVYMYLCISYILNWVLAYSKTKKELDIYTGQWIYCPPMLFVLRTNLPSVKFSYILSRERKFWILSVVTIKYNIWTSLAAQWIEICLPMQRTRVQFEPLSGKIAYAVKEQSPCATRTEALTPWSHPLQLVSLRAAATKGQASRVCVLPQEKPPQWEAWALQGRLAPIRHS